MLLTHPNWTHLIVYLNIGKLKIVQYISILQPSWKTWALFKKQRHSVGTSFLKHVDVISQPTSATAMFPLVATSPWQIETTFHRHSSSCWLNQPMRKILYSQIGSFPQGSGWKSKYLKPPTRQTFMQPSTHEHIYIYITIQNTIRTYSNKKSSTNCPTNHLPPKLGCWSRDLWHWEPSMLLTTWISSLTFTFRQKKSTGSIQKTCTFLFCNYSWKPFLNEKTWTCLNSNLRFGGYRMELQNRMSNNFDSGSRWVERIVSH